MWLKSNFCVSWIYWSSAPAAATASGASPRPLSSMSAKPKRSQTRAAAGMYSNMVPPNSSMAFSFCLRNRGISSASSAVPESTASRGEKRPNSLRIWETGSLS